MRIQAETMRMPHVETGQRVGLFGGSFNPPHQGHVLVSETALKRLQLDQIWWIVTPGNPLKNTNHLAPLNERLEACQAINENPAVEITAFERSYPTRYTVDTLEIVTQQNPGVHFVWVMGADNLGQFHKWERWRTIAEIMPIAVIDRPGSTLQSLSSMAAIGPSRFRLDEWDAPILPYADPPAWVFIHGPRSSLSSTHLRSQRSR